MFKDEKQYNFNIPPCPECRKQTLEADICGQSDTHPYIYAFKVYCKNCGASKMMKGTCKGEVLSKFGRWWTSSEQKEMMKGGGR